MIFISRFSSPLVSCIHRYGYETPQSQKLLEALQNSSSFEPIKNALSYLATTSHPKLETALRTKITPSNVQPLASYLLLEVPHLLEIYYKVTPFDAFKPKDIDIVQHAQDEACFMPHPTETSFASKFTSHLALKPGVIAQVVNYVVSIVAWSYHINLKNPPKSYGAARAEWMFFRSLIGDLQWAGVALLTYFVTVRKTVVASLAIFTVLACMKVLYHWLGFDQHLQINKTYIQELTSTENTFSVSEDEMNRLITCLCTPSEQQPNIPILIGPPGVGKTQLVKIFAQMISSGEIPRLRGKQVFLVNAPELSQIGDWAEGQYRSRLDGLLEEIKDGKAILFIDEAHTLASAEGYAVGGKGLLLEALKTKLLERHILCLFATTQEEYENHIEPNKAIVDRFDLIHVKEPNLEKTKQILRNQFLHGEVDIDPKAIDAVVETANFHPETKNRANPRKSILLMQKAINHVYSWTPRQLKISRNTLQSEINELQHELNLLARDNPSWKTAPETAQKLAKLKEKQNNLKQLNTTIAAQSALHQQFVTLKELQNTYRQRKYTLVHKLAKAPHEEDIKGLAWVEWIILPTLKKLVDQTIEVFLKEYKETIPEKVTADTVKKLLSEQKE